MTSTSLEYPEQYAVGTVALPFEVPIFVNVLDTKLEHYRGWLCIIKEGNWGGEGISGQ